MFFSGVLCVSLRVRDKGKELVCRGDLSFPSLYLNFGHKRTCHEQLHDVVPRGFQKVMGRRGFEVETAPLGRGDPPVTIFVTVKQTLSKP